MRIILIALIWATGCTVYTYEGPPPSYVTPVYQYQPAPMMVRAPVRYWTWSRTYTVVPGRHRHQQPCESRGRRSR